MGLNLDKVPAGGLAPRFALGLAVAAATLWGWRTFWFLTDDAFIAFRYVSNSVLGRGYVWNPEPFRAVEGYTSFAWVALLDGVWRVTGVEPPDSANVLSLGFGLATLFLGSRIFLRAAVPAAWERLRLPLLTLALIATLGNRTFLAWLSSGLETSLFNFCVTLWLGLALTRPVERTRRWVTALTGAATAIALTRPDGLLFAAASVVLILTTGSPGFPRRVAVVSRAWPFLLLAGHLLWRRSRYGFWVPNTYYAKLEGAWPESGLRYLASFGIEYGLWVLALLALAVLLGPGRRALRGHWRAHWHAIVAVGTLAAHLGYYTLIVGGDHFEYRVYSYTIWLSFLSAAWLVTWLTPRRGLGIALLLAFIAASWPIPWTHWARTRHLETRAETHILIHPIADAFPGPLRPAVAVWDGLQAWLIEHHVGMRHQEHKVFWISQIRRNPTREEGAKIAWQDHPVMLTGQVGVPGWVLPNVAILDYFGLNDAIVARQPRTEKRLMAHGRIRPQAYYSCFRPNVHRVEAQVTVRERVEPLSDDQIRRCQDFFWNALFRPPPGPRKTGRTERPDQT